MWSLTVEYPDGEKEVIGLFETEEEAAIEADEYEFWCFCEINYVENCWTDEE